MKAYLCIDLKSFYASVECVERGLDPMATNLVVADPERSTGTLCLAVSPSLKKLGVKNRCRVFEIPAGIPYLMAVPRMQKYIDYAADIYGIYLRYLSPDDIHVYSIDEAFLDVTPYLNYYHKTPRQMAQFLMGKVSEETGIRSSCGIGTNLYLSKVALDITAKHSPDFIGMLDEKTYRQSLWDHQPLVDFWRIGPGTQRHLNRLGIQTQRGIAMAREELLYKEFGIDAELMIDHAWGRETTSMADIKKYRPKSRCLSNFQVLLRDYAFEEGELIVKEMADVMCLDMVAQNLVTDCVGLYVGYSGKIEAPSVHASLRLPQPSSADSVIVPLLDQAYRRLVTPGLPIRHIGVMAGELTNDQGLFQVDLYDGRRAEKLDKNKRVQEAVLQIKARYGKNAVLKAMNYEQAGTTRARNHQIGGHKSGR